MEDWKKLIDSQVSNEYVTPLYPKSDEDVIVKIKVTNNVESVFLFISIDGINTKNSCDIENGYASCKIQLKNNEPSLYYFVLVADSKYYYYSMKGLTSFIPGYKDYFEIIPDLKAPTWISGSTCYQIFPDRFKDGDSSLDLKDGEYEFDGGIVRNMSFSDKPLEFAEGKCLDFFGGDFQGIIDSIDYFKRINVDTLYLNPIGVSYTTHRYDCCDFFHIDPKLGGDDMFIKMVNCLHENGIKVIVDISINHTGTNHPWFVKANEDPTSKEANYYYIDDNGKVAFWEDVPTLPQLNYSHEALRDIMYKDTTSVLKKFLKPPFNQDGWRLDVADVVGRRDEDQLTHEIWREVRESVKTERSDAYLVGECWVDANSHLKGDEWDATMNYIGCSRPIRKWMGEMDRFLLEGWGQNPLSDVPYTGYEMKEALKSQLDNVKGQMRFFQMNLIDSHDTPRLHNNKNVMNQERYNGVVSLMYLLPGMPSVYYGDEIGLDGDVDCVEHWRYPMQWNESVWNMDSFNHYKKMGKIRKTYNKLLATGNYGFLDCDDEMMSFVRYNNEESIILVLNRGYQRTVEINRSTLNGKSIEILDGEGDVILTDNAIEIGLNNDQSLVLHLS